MSDTLEQESIINEDSLAKLANESIEEWFNRISFPKCKECTVSKDRPYRYQVYPKGPIDAPIVLVGEAPGKQEEEEEEAFVGPAGQKLEEALVNAGVDSSKFYITNTVKCRPLENRAPVAEECKKCRDLFLKHEINAYPRKLVIGVGNIGYYGVVPKRTPSGIMSRTGIFEENEEFNCLVLPCVHPAAVLRTPSNQPLLDDVAVKIAQFIGNNYNLQEKTPVNYKEVRTIVDFNKCIKEIKEKKKVVVDLETNSLDYYTGKILCISLSTAPFTGWYIPVIENDDSAWSRYDWTTVQEGLREVFEDPTIDKIGHNLKFDLEFLIHNFKWEVKGQLDDTMLMHHMLDENTAHGLKDLSTRLTDLGSYAAELEEALNLIKRSRIPIEEKHFGKIPLDILIKYTCTDVDATFRLYELFKQQLIEQELYDTYRFVVMDVMPVLMKMEMTGVRIDKTKIDELKIELKQQIDELHIKISSYLPGKDKKKLELEQKIKNAEEAQDFYMSSALTTPKKLWELKKKIEDLNDEISDLDEPEINIKSVAQLRELLYTELKLPVLKKTDKGAASTDEETLTLLQEKTNHPILTDLLEYRRISKLYSTYVTGLDELISPDGKLHTSYSQHTTTTGRLASSKPNLQQVPRESTVRQLFTATEGWYLVTADFKQAELRVFAQESQDLKFIEALTSGDVHSNIGSILLNKPADKITKEERTKVKGCVFGLIYGRSANSLAAEFKMSPQEAQMFINKFFEMMPSAAQWLLDKEKEAKTNGWVRSLFGRIRRLPTVYSSDQAMQAMAARQARNCVAEGTLISTSIGLVPIETLCSGEELNLKAAGMFGDITLLRGIYSGEQECLRITLDDGRTLDVTENHLIYYLDDFGKVAYKPVSDFKIGDFLITPKEYKTSYNTVFDWEFKSEKNWYYKPLTIPNKMTVELAELLGTIIGDGCMTQSPWSICIAVGHRDEQYKDIIVNLVQKIFDIKSRVTLHEYGDHDNFWIEVNSVPFKRFLNFIGLGNVTHKDKVVPWSILCSGSKFKAAFLRGIFDTDGSVSSGGVISFSCYNSSLGRQVQLLLLELGITCTFSKEKSTNSKNWQVVIGGISNLLKFKNLISFSVEFKRLRLEDYLSKTKERCTGLPDQLQQSILNEFKNINTDRTLQANLKKFRIGRTRLRNIYLPLLEKNCKDTTEFKKMLDLTYNEVVSIETIGICKTYDLCVKEELPVFVANGVCVHNSPIQSAASDITNRALVSIDRAFKERSMKSRLLMQVHDSVALESPPDEVKEAIQILEECMTAKPHTDFNVPLAVDIEISDRWGGEKIKLEDL